VARGSGFTTVEAEEGAARTAAGTGDDAALIFTDVSSRRDRGAEERAEGFGFVGVSHKPGGREGGDTSAYPLILDSSSCEAVYGLKGF
jgi:hypothetical protein